MAVVLVSSYSNPQKLVFTEADGAPFRPSTVGQRFRSALRRHGLPHVRLHDLRHSFGTNMIRAGVDARVLKDLLGHANVAFTLQVYTHPAADMQTRAVELLDRLVWDDDHAGD